MAGCLTDSQIGLLADGELSAAAFSEVEGHLGECAACRQRVESETLFQEVQALFREDGSNQPDSRTSEKGAVHSDLEGGEIPGYRIINEIHRGGQGIVYKAVQTATKRVVALKVLLRGAFATERQRRRFEREIDVVASLNHPNVVTIFESGVSGNRHYFAMEYVEGRPLDQFASPADLSESHSKAVVTQRQYIAIFRKICDAVSHAHQRGVIHRDLKPGNVLVEEDGEPHVLDFGLAKIADPNLEQQNTVFRTQEGEFLGTLAYASPEQTSGTPSLIDTRSDVYSLGIMLFEMLTSCRPYSVDGSLSDVLHNIREVEPTRPSAIAPVDQEMETIILKALAKDPDRRYQSAYHLARDLQHYLNGEALEAKRDSSWYLLRKTLRRHRLALATSLSFLAIIVIAFVCSLFFWRRAVLDRNIAQAATIEATAARVEAEHQRTKAVSQREAARVAQDEAEFQAYAANIAAADAALRNGDVADARLRLSQAPSAKRDWEWYQLTNSLDSSQQTLSGHTSYVEKIAVLPRRKLLASTGWDHSLRLWSLMDGQEIHKFELPSPAWSLTISADEQLVAVGDWGHMVHVFDIDSGEAVFEFHGPTQRVPALAFTHNDEYLVASYWAFGKDELEQSGNRLLFLDLDQGQVAHELPVRDAVQDIYLIEGTHLIAASDSLGTQIIDTELYRVEHELSGRALSVSADGALAVFKSSVAPQGSDVEHSYVLQVRRLEDDRLVSQLTGHRGEVFGGDFFGEGRLATASRDKTVRVWDAFSGQLLHTYLGHEWTVTSVAFYDANKGDSPTAVEGNLFSASWDRSIKRWKTTAALGSESIRAHDGRITDVATRGKLLATSSVDRSVKIWDFPQRKLIRTLRGHTAPVQSIAISPDGRHLVSASWDHTLKLWNLENGECEHTLEGHTDLVLGVAFHTDGSFILSGSRDNTLRMWSLNGDCLHVLTGHDDHVHSVVFCRDGQHFASCGHRSVKLWSTDQRREVASFPRTILQEDYSLAFHPDGNLLVAGSSQALRFWDLAKREIVDDVPAHTDEILAVCFNASGTRAVSASIDGAVKVWDVAHRIPLCTLGGNSSRIQRVHFSSEEQILIGGTDSGEIIFWNGEPDD